MTLERLLAPAHVLVPMPAGTLDVAVELLLATLVADGSVSDPRRLATDVANVRPADAIAAFPSAFLPHYRTEAVPELVAALGVAPAPLEARGRRARIVLLLLAPPTATTAYLQAVAAFGRALSRPETVDALHAATTPEAAAALPIFAETRLTGPLLVRDIMTMPARSLRPEDTLVSAARELLRRGVEAMPVVGVEGEVLGLLTHEELLRHLVPTYVQSLQTGEHRAIGAAEAGDLSVRDVMTRSVLCLAEDQTVSEVAQLMAAKKLDRFPVVRDGRLTGFLTRADLVRRLIGPA